MGTIKYIKSISLSMSDIESFNEMMRFLKFSYLQKSSFDGTLCFEVIAKNGQTLIRTVNIDGNKRKIQIFENRPEHIKINCLLRMSIETFLEIYSGKHPVTYIMNGSVKVDNLWQSTIYVKGFGKSFNFDSENWRKFYEYEEILKFEKERKNRLENTNLFMMQNKKNPQKSEIPESIGETDFEEEFPYEINNEMAKSLKLVQQNTTLSVAALRTVSNICHSPRPGRFLNGISGLFSNKKFCPLKKKKKKKKKK